MPQTSDLFEKLALIFLHNFHRKRILLKFLIKKLSPKINVININSEFRRHWPVSNSILYQCVCKQVRLRFSANVYQAYYPYLSSAVQLFCTIKAYLCCFTHFTVDKSKLTVNGSVLSDTPNVRYLVALYVLLFRIVLHA